ncbi:MAG: tRNA preQ1(34) S-adenosylmethionine ribosyltransferase-isomerase QueA [Nanoarchaeota archaeon]|nr:tRNA preQ1(34) S-adenosylmethionine ribosyltransferase-isomerase QueA [Nanoarchaeota archaeon]MBU0978145.1 tRNA preQ1(34) S-adenosylmethionine ribosyltransferase-isomerase QueA [Nanoarchaeota archaeon]
MNINDFNYLLPKELIAQRPASPRTHSRLMILNNPAPNSPPIEHKHFYDLPDYLKEDDVLVINETKVLPIRITGKKQTGGKVELMLALNSNKATIKGRAKVGDDLIFPDNIKAKILSKKDNKVRLKFNLPVNEIINKIGSLPTPPYIKTPIKSDDEYQTVYANQEGSFAAPTAGLHFNQELLQKIKNKGVKIAKVCLHVSWDTFLPVTEEDPTKHKIHGEVCEITKQNSDIINKAKRLFVVGTTTLRTLESFAEDGKIYSGKKLTKIFIYPGYKFKLNYTGLITNFHLPKSTLLMMISAFYSREKILEAYEIAIKEKYRFYSLGDAMLILK